LFKTKVKGDDYLTPFYINIKGLKKLYHSRHGAWIDPMDENITFVAGVRLNNLK
jgi:hypothetical protein